MPFGPYRICSWPARKFWVSSTAIVRRLDWCKLNIDHIEFMDPANPYTMIFIIISSLKEMTSAISISVKTCKSKTLRVNGIYHAEWYLHSSILPNNFVAFLVNRIKWKQGPICYQ
jgi:hypothetical protein